MYESKRYFGIFIRFAPMNIRHSRNFIVGSSITLLCCYPVLCYSLIPCYFENSFMQYSLYIISNFSLLYAVILFYF